MATSETRPWEQLEEYLIPHQENGTDFSAVEYAAEEGLDTEEASAAIQEYLAEQRRPEGKALFVLYRVPGTRTFSARWLVGIKASNARLIGEAFADDCARKAKRAFRPDLQQIARRNPRAAKLTESQIDAVLDGAMAILAAAVQGAHSDGEGTGS